MDKCVRCGLPIVWGVKFFTLRKGNEIAYMCEQCMLETTEEQRKQA